MTILVDTNKKLLEFVNLTTKEKKQFKQIISALNKAKIRHSSLTINDRLCAICIGIRPLK